MFDWVLFSTSTAQKKKFSIKNFFSKCDQIRNFLRIPHFLMESAISCNVLRYIGPKVFTYSNVIIKISEKVCSMFKLTIKTPEQRLIRGILIWKLIIYNKIYQNWAFSEFKLSFEFYAVYKLYTLLSWSLWSGTGFITKWGRN